MPDELRFGDRVVKLTHLDKVLFPDDGFTKRDLVDYYQFIAPVMVPLLQGHPLTMHRFPDGLGKFSFYQKEISDYFPEWIHRATLPKQGGTVTHVLCDDEATLLYLANQGCITPHLWLSRYDRAEFPDRMIFDLDPPGDDYTLVQWVALRLRDFLYELGLRPLVMATGSRGLHLLIPMDRKLPFAEVRRFVQDVAGVMATRYPEKLTIEPNKHLRGNRVIVDDLRNSYGATVVAPYAIRARRGAPIAVPLSWAEVESADYHPRRWTLKTIRQRLPEDLRLWSDLRASLRPLRTAIRRVTEVREAEKIFV